MVIAGAGPAGCAAAYYLVRAGIDVLLLDKSDFPRDKTCGDGLTPRAVGVLEDMGILDRIEPLAHRVDGLEFIGHDGKRIIVSSKTKSPHPNYLLVIPRLVLDEIILQRATDTGAKFIGNSRVMGVEDGDGRAQVTVQHGANLSTYTASVVLMATGAVMGLPRAVGLIKRGLPEPMLAARTYYENVKNLTNQIQIHFFDQILPGYGWVFPISTSAANIGVGLGQMGANKGKRLRSLMEAFLKTPLLKQMLSQATQIGVVESYPLRSDFLTASTVKGRVLAIGESAGLVNPLTGDGIDFALESGKLGAEFLLDQFNQGELRPELFNQYDRILRAHYQRKFIFFEMASRLLRYPTSLRAVFSVLERSRRARRLAVNVLLR